MKLFYKILITFLLVGSTTSCINKNSYKKLIRVDEGVQEILIVSSMGNDFESKFVGFTVFTNNHKTIDVTKWDIDSEIENKIANFNVNKNFKITSMDLRDIKSKYPKLAYDNFLSKSKFNGLDKEIFTLANKKGFDLVIFVQTYTSDDYVFFTGVPVSGYGLYKRSSDSKLYAVSFISIYDVKTGNKILNLPAGVYSQFDNKYRNTKAENISFEQINDDKDTMINLILKGVKERMQWVKIIPSDITE